MMTLEQIRTALRHRPRPGLAAQMRMAPSYRWEMLRRMPPPERVREAGVLILLYPCDDALCFPLTRRTEQVENHKGQISLPGGAREPGEPLAETALRETREELGISLDGLEMLGSLTPLYIPPSGFQITPFVAYLPYRPRFHPDPVEVAEVIPVPLAALFDPTIRRQELRELRGQPVRIPFYAIQGHQVWGATAMVLSELAAILSPQSSPKKSSTA